MGYQKKNFFNEHGENLECFTQTDCAILYILLMTKLIYNFQVFSYRWFEWTKHGPMGYVSPPESIKKEDDDFCISIRHLHGWCICWTHNVKEIYYSYGQLKIEINSRPCVLTHTYKLYISRERGCSIKPFLFCTHFFFIPSVVHLSTS